MDRLAYSWREDPSVPPFDDSGPVAVMDGHCALCTTGARLLARFDRAGVVRIARAETDLGAALLRHHGKDPADPESWLMLVEGQAYGSLEAVIKAGAIVGGPGWLLQGFRVLPRTAQDWLYARIARNRYALFGRTEMCQVPDSRLKARLIG